jgi:hypothetical protein
MKKMISWRITSRVFHKVLTDSLTGSLQHFVRSFKKTVDSVFVLDERINHRALFCITGSRCQLEGNRRLFFQLQKAVEVHFSFWGAGLEYPKCKCDCKQAILA